MGERERECNGLSPPIAARRARGGACRLGAADSSHFGVSAGPWCGDGSSCSAIPVADCHDMESSGLDPLGVIDLAARQAKNDACECHTG